MEIQKYDTQKTHTDVYKSRQETGVKYSPQGDKTEVCQEASQNRTGRVEPVEISDTASLSDPCGKDPFYQHGQRAPHEGCRQSDERKNDTSFQSYEHRSVATGKQGHALDLGVRIGEQMDINISDDTDRALTQDG